MSDRDVDINIRAQTADAEQGMARAAESIGRATLLIREHFGKLGEAIEGVKVSFLAVGAILAGGELFKDAIERTAELAVDLEKASAKTGMSVEALSKLKYAAEQSHVSFEELIRGLQRMSLGMQDAANGTGTAAKAYDALGIHVLDANGRLRSNETMLGLVADKFSTMANGTQKTALAMQIFGRAGADLIPILNDGSKGLKELGDEAELLGVAMGEHGVQAAEHYHDGMLAVQAALHGTQQALATSLAPVLMKLNEMLTESLLGFKQLAREAELTFKAIASAGGSLTKMWQNLLAANKQMAQEHEQMLSRIQAMWARIENSKPPGASGNPAGTHDDGADRLKQMELEKERRHQLDMLALEKDRYDFETKMGEHSAEEQLENDKDLLAKEQAINAEFYAKELALFNGNEKEKARIQAEMSRQSDEYALKSQHAQEEIALHLKATIEQMIKSLVDGFQNATTGLIDHTMKLKDAYLKIGEQVEHFFIDSAFRSLRTHFATEQAKTGATAAGSAERVAIEAAANAKSLATDIATAFKKIATLIATSMAKAYDAMVGIPYVGPAVAPGAAAQAGATIAGFGSMLAVAERGYDIPAGINPMTQLHAQEMVLPAEIANMIRGMARGGGGGGGGDTFHVHCTDSASLEDYLRRNGRAVAQGVKAAQRHGHLPSPY